MKRCLFSLALCVFCGGDLIGGELRKELQQSREPAAASRPKPADAHLAAPLAGRRKLEALLQAPAKVDFGQRQSVTVKDVLEQLREKHRLSIRLDMPTFTYLLAGEGASAPKVFEQHAASIANLSPYGVPVYVANGDRPAGVNFEYPPFVTPAGVVATASPAVPLPAPAALVAAAAEPAVAAPVAAPASAPPAAASRATAPPGPPAPAYPAAAPAAVLPPRSATGSEQLVSPTTPAAAEPNFDLKVKDKSDSPVASPDKTPEVRRTPAESLAALLNTEIDLKNLDLTNISVATLLRHALDSATVPGAADEFGGLPVPMTNAMLLDFLVEEDDLLITTRMKALTHKETRVYSVKHLQEIPPEQLAKIIRQAVRPWSWRSQISDLGEQLKGTPLPPQTLSSVVKSGIQLAAGEFGATVTTPETEKPQDEKNASESNQIKETIMLGNAVVNSLVTFVQATLSSLEMFHYAEPPTASIQTLPGKLVITQSQAAHHEIAELLRQLAEE